MDPNPTLLAGDAAGRLLRMGSAVLSDAVLSLGRPLRLGGPGLRRAAGGGVAGRCVVVRHRGSVDVFLAAIDGAAAGDVLVIDNDGRTDEGCIGDLVALEVQAAGLAGIVVWGSHRDSAVLREIGLAVFSYGTCPAGPRRGLGAEEDPHATEPPWDRRRVHPGVGTQRLDADDGQAPRFGATTLSGDDWCCADDDGVVFVAAAELGAVLSAAERIHERERLQAAAVRTGRSLREQFQFALYEQKRRLDPGYTLRQHLQRLGGAIEV